MIAVSGRSSPLRASLAISIVEAAGIAARSRVLAMLVATAVYLGIPMLQKNVNVLHITQAQRLRHLDQLGKERNLESCVAL